MTLAELAHWIPALYVIFVATLLGALAGLAMTMPGGLPPPRPDQGYDPTGSPMAPGSPNVVRARQVIVSGTGNATGVWVYSGSPGLGNPPILSLSDSTVDPFGNTTDSAGQPLVPGVVSYGSAGYAQLLAGALSFLFPGASSPAVVDMGAAGDIVINSGLVGGGDQSAQIAIQSQQAAGGTSTINIAAQLATLSGALTVGGNINAPSSTIDVHNGNVNLNMARPPNYAAVVAGTATAAQVEACLGGLLTSLTNRQLMA